MTGGGVDDSSLPGGDGAASHQAYVRDGFGVEGEASASSHDVTGRFERGRRHFAGAAASDRDRGSASIWVLAVGLLVTLIGLGCVAAGRAAIGAHQAQMAADMGALAGAATAALGRDAACASASEIVGDNGAHLSACVVVGLDVIVTAKVEVKAGPIDGVAVASARAGPRTSAIGPPGVD